MDYHLNIVVAEHFGCHNTQMSIFAECHPDNASDAGDVALVLLRRPKEESNTQSFLHSSGFLVQMKGCILRTGNLGITAWYVATHPQMSGGVTGKGYFLCPARRPSADFAPVLVNFGQPRSLRSIQPEVNRKK